MATSRNLSAKILIKRATATVIASSTVVLSAGELLFNTTDKTLYLGDGVTQLKNLPAYSGEESSTDTGNTVGDITLA